jgi:hypothetical protein
MIDMREQARQELYRKLEYAADRVYADELLT